MGHDYFDFKEFRIRQEKVAMRVNTDSIILGAIISNSLHSSILDIGSGTGILSLMMAQKFLKAKIYAIDVDKNAFLQSKINFQLSKYSARLCAIYSDLKDYSLNAQAFDLIISNPPYFEQKTLAKTKERQIARQGTLLSYRELALNSAKLMHLKSEIWLIIPYEQEAKLIASFMLYNLAPFYRMRIFSKPDKAAFRTVLAFSFGIRKLTLNCLTIYDENLKYSSKFKDLTREFYLDFHD